MVGGWWWLVFGTVRAAWILLYVLILYILMLYVDALICLVARTCCATVLHFQVIASSHRKLSNCENCTEWSPDFREA